MSVAGNGITNKFASKWIQPFNGKNSTSVGKLFFLSFQSVFSQTLWEPTRERERERERERDVLEEQEVPWDGESSFVN